MIKFKRNTNCYNVKLEEKENKIYIHIDVFKYNRKKQKELMILFNVICSALKKEGYDKIYFTQAINDNKLLKFSSIFAFWDYEYTLTLTNGNEYNLLSCKI